jgi:alkylation response protein AidB-like acyl-CoA dehydrogenase
MPNGGVTKGRAIGVKCRRHGGYGYINEYLIARLFRDSRVQRGMRLSAKKSVTGRTQGMWRS